MKPIISLILAAALTGLCPGADEVAKDQPLKVGQAAGKIAAGVQLLDVRTPEEWDEGHLKGAKRVGIADDDFVARVKEIFDPKKPVVVYCRSGKRSAKAAKQLQDAGFTNLHDMAGGIIAWQKEGKPVVK
ncbi:MAG: rhodanese-like domain-containing protein [Verrucomicrobiota bacterium]